MADKKISELTAYTPAVDVDLVPIVDTTAGITKHITWANIKATLKTYFDSLTTTLTNKTLTSPKINEDVALTATATQLNTIVGLAKATAAENVTGTDDAKFLTPLANVPAFNSSMARQAIINGNFDVWQRGTSFTASGFTADRFKHTITGSSCTVTKQTFTLGQTDVPNNPKYYMRNVVTTSAGASNRVSFTQPIESVTTFAGQTVTLSFWAKADASKNISVEFYQYFGAGGSPSAINTGMIVRKIALTTSWAKYTITDTFDSISGKTLGTDGTDTVVVNFWLDAGSDLNARTDSLGQQSGTFEFSEVQLCAGDIALPFMPKSFEEELRACQRYYEKSYLYTITPGTADQNAFFINGYDTANVMKAVSIPYKVTKRVSVTPVLYDEAGTINKIGTVATNGAVTNNVDANIARGIDTQFTVFLTTAASGLSIHWTASAEL